MAISFDSISPTLRVPFVAAEFNASQASQGPALLAYRALIIGQKITAGTGTADTLYRVTNADQVLVLAGRGSMLHRQAIAWFASNQSTELWIGILDDDGSGVPATGTITVTGTATGAGTCAIYVGGTRYPITVAIGDTPTVIAAAIAAAINADLDAFVTAVAAVGVVTLTARNDGEAGNDVDHRSNYRDTDAFPEAVSVAHVAMSSGATNPTLTNLIAALGDTWFNIIVHPYLDATSLTAIEAEMSDRFGPMRMIDGVAITSASDSHANLTTLGNGRNSQHSMIVAQPGANPLTHPMEFAAEQGAIIAKYGTIDPARPFQTLAMSHAVAPAEADLFTLDERNLLLFDGIATSKVAAGGVVQLERPITTYQTNASGAADTAYLDVNTMLTLMYLRYSFRVRMQSKYPRHKLADDGTRFGAGQAIITPKLGKAEAVGWFKEMEALGLVENLDQFKQDIIVERNVSDQNRLDFLLPPDLINALIVTAAQIAFRL